MTREDRDGVTRQHVFCCSVFSFRAAPNHPSSPPLSLSLELLLKMMVTTMKTIEKDTRWWRRKKKKKGFGLSLCFSLVALVLSLSLLASFASAQPVLSLPTMDVSRISVTLSRRMQRFLIVLIVLSFFFFLSLFSLDAVPSGVAIHPITGAYYACSVRLSLSLSLFFVEFGWIDDTHTRVCVKFSQIMSEFLFLFLVSLR